MYSEPDPFIHHPELRDKVGDPLKSFFRNFKPEEVFTKYPELIWVLDKLYTDEYRTASRNAVLDLHGDSDLWVFAYGSLMWDPAFIFDEVRRARVTEYARRFVLKDVWGARGTVETPGLFAALDTGDGCEGLVYHIAREKVDAEIEILWRREMVGPGYLPKFVTAMVDGKPIRVLAFIADHSAENIQPNLCRSEQIEFISTGTGILGTSLEYLQNIVGQFDALGIVEEECTTLLDDVQNHIKTQ
ncbi:MULTISPECIES: gamma-glutamylcyclotransferase [unclassified Falsihalocynthiibacter]